MAVATSAGQLALDVLIALVTTAAIAAILYAPLWAGVHSFDGLLQRGQPMSSASPFGAVNWVLRRSPLAAHAGPLTLALVTLPLLGFIAWISLRVKDAVGLARAFAWISVVYALLTSPDYWPWYVCMPVALLIMADVGELLWLIMLLSITARLCAPLDLIRDHGFFEHGGGEGHAHGRLHHGAIRRARGLDVSEARSIASDIRLAAQVQPMTGMPAVPQPGAAVPRTVLSISCMLATCQV